MDGRSRRRNRMKMSEFKKKKEELLAAHSGPDQGTAFSRAYARLLDETLTGLFESAVEEAGGVPGLALAALGGYGRGGMSPGSDVDLLFLASKDVDQSPLESVVESVLYPLWDLKLDVGHAIRTPQQCLDLAKEDFATMSAQLDARFLTGDVTVHFEFMEALFRRLGAKARKKSFFKDLVASVEERHAKYGQSPYLLEPNVKEGQGALRDIHAMIWAAIGLYDFSDLEEVSARGLLSADRLEELWAARCFMTDVRHHLHRLSGGRNDDLTFDLQDRVSEVLGYRSEGHVSGVERFMQRYYTHVYRTKNTLDYFFSRIREDLMPSGIRRFTRVSRTVERGLTIRRGQIELGTRAEVSRKPILMMRAFEVSAGSGLPVSQRSLELIRTHLDLVDDDYRGDAAVAKSFKRMISLIPPRRPELTGFQTALQVLDFLEAYIPELGAVRAQVQYDAYHVYTVDVHLVLAWWQLKKIALGISDPESGLYEQSVFQDINQPELLFLAGLLHDIGKGRGADHSAEGAAMVPAIGRRLGLSQEETDTVAYLIADHLYLAHIATRRDLSEEKLIVDCARRVGDVQRLNMLTLLTFADSRATGPAVLTQWKAVLLRNLYSRLYRVLTRTGLAGKEEARHDEELCNQVREKLAGRLSSKEVESRLGRMSAHYLSAMRAEDVVGHIHLEREMEERKATLVWEVEEKAAGYCQVTILAQDRPGLLSRMAGVFTLHNINILGAQVFTRANNIALDVFQVDYPPDRMFAEETWSKVKRDAERVLTGHMALDYRLSKKSPLLTAKGLPTRQPDRVIIDNETSDFYTIVEIHTYDRLGLLYEITKSLFDLQLSINIAKISTNADQVVDVFYVRDFLGEKLLDEAQTDELKEALLHTLSQKS